jgi:hypothetical protein
MEEGIMNSKVVLVCLNQAYERSKNCMFELKHAYNIKKDNIVTLITQPDPLWNSTTNSPGWAGGNTTHGNAKDMCALSTKMFVDIGELCAKPGWPGENDPDDTAVPNDLLNELRDKIADLIKLLEDAPLNCRPSMPRV